MLSLLGRKSQKALQAQPSPTSALVLDLGQHQDLCPFPSLKGLRSEGNSENLDLT